MSNARHQLSSLNPSAPLASQQGVVLIACMIVLLIVTLLGTTAMQGSGMELKMVKNFEQRQQVFQAAEATLRAVETEIALRPFTANQLATDTCLTANSCFDDTCGGGLCFLGVNVGPAESNCRVYDDPGTAGIETAPQVPIWLDDGTLSTSWGKVWGNDTKTNYFGELSTSLSGVSTEYIVEFQCFLEAGGAWLPFYRITVLAENSTGTNQVMLQSTMTTDDLN